MIEKKLQISLILTASVLLVAGLIIYQFNFGLSCLLLIFFFLIAIGAFVLEMYFRIQHNLDGNLKDSYYLEQEDKLKQQLDQKINELDKKLNSEIAGLKNKMTDFENKNRIQILELDKKLTKLSESNRYATDKFFWHYVKENRANHLADLAPKLFKYKSVLYVGARIDRSDFLSNFKNNGSKITILEIHKPNVNYFKTLPWVSEVIEGDVTEFKSNHKYDVVFWWHGPEHIEKSKLADTLKNLESITKKIIVLGCPWGEVPQNRNIEQENPYEKHVSYFDIGEFEKFGYKTDYSGIKDNSGSNIISVKFKK